VNQNLKLEVIEAEGITFPNNSITALVLVLVLVLGLYPNLSLSSTYICVLAIGNAWAMGLWALGTRRSCVRMYVHI